MAWTSAIDLDVVRQSAQSNSSAGVPIGGAGLLYANKSTRSSAPTSSSSVSNAMGFTDAISPADNDDVALCDQFVLKQ
eukprot:15367116-Ditylum_brightwellii.AAC.1